MEYKDSDGFELLFEEDTIGSVKDYFAKEYPNLNNIVKEKLHCTACDTHIGSAPIIESIVRTHNILKVTVCQSCYTFYNSGEFEKGEDGYELFCRWCGQGGEVYCCCKCSFVFCKNCILRNLSEESLLAIQQNDKWACFSCENGELKRLQARHWALKNYMEKQKINIQKKYFTADKISYFMRKDNSNCCKTKPKKLRSRPSPSQIATAKKRKLSASSLRVVELDTDQNVSASPVIETQKTTNLNVTKNSARKMRKMHSIPKRTTKLTDEVICTPDILELSDQDESVDTTSSEIPSFFGFNDIQCSVPNELLVSHPSSSPAILPIQSSSPSEVKPIFSQDALGVVGKSKSKQINILPSKSVHDLINGFKIDIEKASKQDAYHLPNGTIIKAIDQKTINNAKYLIDERPSQELARLGHLSQSIKHNQQKDTKNQQDSQQSKKKPNQNILNSNTLVKQSNLKPQLTKLPPQFSETDYQPMFEIIPNIKNSSSPRMQESSPKPFSQVQTRMQRYFPRTSTKNIINPSTPNQEPAMVLKDANYTAQAALEQSLNKIGMGRNICEPAMVSEKANDIIQDALEKSRNRIRMGFDICDEIKAKFNCLAKSHSYRNSESRAGVLDLNLHLSYLFAHAIGRFQNLQDLCNEDLKLLGDENAEIIDDEVQLVETKTTIIEILSDDEEIETISNDIKTIKTESKVLENHTNPESIVFHHLLSAETNESISRGNFPNKTNNLLIDDDECEVINIDFKDDVVDNTTAENIKNKVTLCNSEVFDEVNGVLTQDENLSTKVDNLVPTNDSSENHKETVNEMKKDSISTFGNWKRCSKDAIILVDDENEYRKANLELCDARSSISDSDEVETNTDVEDFYELVDAMLSTNDKDELMSEQDI